VLFIECVDKHETNLATIPHQAEYRVATSCFQTGAGVQLADDEGGRRLPRGEGVPRLHGSRVREGIAGRAPVLRHSKRAHAAYAGTTKLPLNMQVTINLMARGHLPLASEKDCH
jgi:hypothetical protein